MRRLGAAIAGVLVLLGAVRAHADVDANGAWLVHVDFFLSDVVVPFTQVGTALEALVAPPGAPPPTQPWTGTIDPATGAFTLQGALAGPFCLPMSVTGTVAADGRTFTGSFTTGFFQFPATCVPFTGAFNGTRCGNAVLDPGEQCDPGLGECCNPSVCDFEPADWSCRTDDVCTDHVCDGLGTCRLVGPADGRSCDDGVFCNGADVCSGGACVHAGDPCAGGAACHDTCDEGTDRCDSPADTRCAPCRACDAAGACVPRALFCRAVSRSTLKVTNRALDASDRIRWSAKTSALLGDFGRPDLGTDWDVCVFDGAASLVVATEAAGGLSWKRTSRGFTYASRSGGVRSLKLGTRGVGDATLVVKGQGDALLLPAPATPAVLPLRVQLQSSNAACFEASYATVSRNDGTTLKAP